MSALNIMHTHADGTLIDGTARGDGTAKILRAQGWRWSRILGSWYIRHSRDRRADTAQIDRTASALRADGFDVDVTIDDTYRAIAEVEADKIDRQAARVDALGAKADRRAADAETAWAADKAAHAALPRGGEPIKIGHHSESRHRRAIDRSWNALGKAVMTEREATAARGRAAAAHTTSARYRPRGLRPRRPDSARSPDDVVPILAEHPHPTADPELSLEYLVKSPGSTNQGTHRTYADSSTSKLCSH